MADALEQRRQDHLRFVASIAHDLRNPLNSIGLAGELLVHKSGGEAGGRDLAAMLTRQIKTLDFMLQDLLDTSRIEAGQFELTVTATELSSLLSDAVALSRSGAKLHHLRLELPDEPLSCDADPLRLSQVLNNLLSNAIKYSPSGGDIVVKAASSPDQIQISVSDQGIGIAPDDLSGIFKPFQRTAATRDTIPGIGLGLSASRHIVEAHGGTLTVDSKPGEGSTFTIRLPRKGKSVTAPAGVDAQDFRNGIVAA